MNSGYVVKPEEQRRLKDWIATIGDVKSDGVEIVSYRQGWGKLRLGQAVVDEPLRLADKVFGWGFGSHADSEIVLRCPSPARLFRSWVGVDRNSATSSHDHPRTAVVFSVWRGDACLWESQPLTVDDTPVHADVPLDGAAEFVLRAKGVGSINYAHVDWAEAELVVEGGQTLKVGTPDSCRHSRMMPMSFIYGGMDSEQWFRKWGVKHTQSADKDGTTHSFLCRDQDTGLECAVELREYANSPACLWNARFTNSGGTATPILEQVRTLDLSWPCLDGAVVHRASGAFHYPEEKFAGEAFRDDFMLSRDELKRPIAMGGVGGRPSVDWMPYFNFQSGNEGLVFGIGWTGQWSAEIHPGFESVIFRAGQEKIHTILEPGESIRQPSILMIHWQGVDAIRGHNLLRRVHPEQPAAARRRADYPGLRPAIRPGAAWSPPATSPGSRMSSRRNCLTTITGSTPAGTARRAQTRTSSRRCGAARRATGASTAAPSRKDSRRSATPSMPTARNSCFGSSRSARSAARRSPWSTPNGSWASVIMASICC